jgi:ComF family protein
MNENGDKLILYLLPRIVVIRKILSWLWPQECSVCGAHIDDNSTFCVDCFSKITFVDHPMCEVCGRILEVADPHEMKCRICCETDRAFDICRSLLSYDATSRRIVMKIKRKADSNVARQCCIMLERRYRELFEGASAIVPVPSHWTRNLKRAYNPPSIIAAELSKITKIPIFGHLKRVRRTEYQAGKSANVRLNNVKGAFSCTRDMKGKNIILIDDVMTTGYTLEECSIALKSANAGKITCLTIASTSEQRT